MIRKLSVGQIDAQLRELHAFITSNVDMLGGSSKDSLLGVLGSHAGVSADARRFYNCLRNRASKLSSAQQLRVIPMFEFVTGTCSACMLQQQEQEQKHEQQQQQKQLGGA